MKTDSTAKRDGVTVHHIVRIIFLGGMLVGPALIGLGAFWLVEYALGEWTGGEGRLEYLANNLWLAFKGPITFIAGVGIMFGSMCGLFIFPNPSDHRHQPGVSVETKSNL